MWKCTNWFTATTDWQRAKPNVNYAGFAAAFCDRRKSPEICKGKCTWRKFSLRRCNSFVVLWIYTKILRPAISHWNVIVERCSVVVRLRCNWLYYLYAYILFCMETKVKEERNLLKIIKIQNTLFLCRVYFKKIPQSCCCNSVQLTDCTPVLDGWMTCDFTSLLTVFQSYQDDVRMIMKFCVHWISIYSWEDFTLSEDRTRSARSVGKRLTHWATGAHTRRFCAFGFSYSRTCWLDVYWLHRCL